MSSWIPADLLAALGLGSALVGRALMEEDSERGLFRSIGRGLVSDGLLGVAAGGGLGYVTNENDNTIADDTIDGMIIGGAVCAVVGCAARLAAWLMPAA